MQIRTWAEAVAVAGTLDILSAFVFSGIKGVGPLTVLSGVATGPFGDAMANSGWTGAAIGLGVHFGIMAIQVAAFMLLASWQPGILQTRIVTGILFGVAVYVAMYWVVLPIRWPDVFPAGALRHIPSALFSHIVCVGLPIALIVSRGAKLRG